MRYELFIALRYVKTEKRQSLLSVLAIGLAVMVLLVSQTLMVGFTEELYDKTIDELPHVSITPGEGEEYIHLYQNALIDIASIEGVVAASPYLAGTATFTSEDLSQNAVLKGIEPLKEDTVSYLAQDITEGDLFALSHSRNSIIMGDDLAKKMELEFGDTIDISFPNANDISLKVVGIYDSGTPVDSSITYISLKSAQDFYDTADVINGISLRIADIHSDLEVAEKVKQKGYNAKGWTETNPEILRTMAIEKTENYIIYSLLLLIASFGVVSTLNMMVMGKIKEIGVLMAMGIPPSGIKKIFLFESGIIGLAGAIIGASAGIMIATMIGEVEIPTGTENYGFSTIPIVIRLSDILLIVIGVFLLNLMAGLYPAGKAASVDPVDAISNH